MTGQDRDRRLERDDREPEWRVRPPATVQCPECDGRGCRECRRAGWVYDESRED